MNPIEWLEIQEYHKKDIPDDKGMLVPRTLILSHEKELPRPSWVKEETGAKYRSVNRRKTMM